MFVVAPGCTSPPSAPCARIWTGSGTRPAVAAAASTSPVWPGRRGLV